MHSRSVRTLPQNGWRRQLGTTNPICPRRGEYLAEFMKGGVVLTCVRGGEFLILQYEVGSLGVLSFLFILYSLFFIK